MNKQRLMLGAKKSQEVLVKRYTERGKHQKKWLKQFKEAVSAEEEDSAYFCCCYNPHSSIWLFKTDSLISF